MQIIYVSNEMRHHRLPIYMHTDGWQGSNMSCAEAERRGGLCCNVTPQSRPLVYTERDSAVCTFQEHTHAHEHEHTHTHELTHTHTHIPSAISVGFAVAVVCRARGNGATAFFSADGTLPQFFFHQVLQLTWRSSKSLHLQKDA